MSPPLARPHPLSVHEAVYYQDTADLAAQIAPLLGQVLSRGDDVALACRHANNRALREALGDDDRVLVVPRSLIYRRAISAVAYVRDFATERFASGSRRVCVVGEVDFGRNGHGVDEWHRYEALLNHVLNGFPLRVMCVYATEVLPEPVLASARLTHPYLRRDGVRLPNPAFVDPAELMRWADSRAHAIPDAEPDAMIPEVLDFAELHEQLSRLLASTGMPQERREDAILAVHELVTNGLRHGEPPVSVRAWTSERRVVCAITDHGPGFDDPFVGYVRGGGEHLPEGRLGLWMARQLCDGLVATRWPEGFTVQLTVRV